MLIEIVLATQIIINLGLLFLIRVLDTRLRKLEFMHQCMLNDPEFVQDYNQSASCIECKGPEFNHEEDEVE